MTQICPIMQEEIINAYTTLCNHTFERGAIRVWIVNQNNSSYPMCRSFISRDSFDEANPSVQSSANSANHGNDSSVDQGSIF